jgi:hypothetical protein
MVWGSNPVKESLSAPIQTGPGASYTMGAGSLSLGYSGRGVAFTTPSYIAPRLKKEQSYTCAFPLGLRGLFSGELLHKLYHVVRISEEA